MPAAAKPAPPAEPISEKKADAPVKNPNPNPDMPAVETPAQPLADVPFNDVVKPAEENPVADTPAEPAAEKPADAPAPEKPADTPAADAPAAPVAPAEQPVEQPAESKPEGTEPSAAPTAEEPPKLDAEKPADAPVSVAAAEPAAASAAAVDAPSGTDAAAPPADTTKAPKKQAQPPPGGVRFGNVEIVAPSEPPAAPSEGQKPDDDDEADEDYNVEKDDDAAADDEEEDGDEMEGLKIPENMPELPKGLLAQLLSSGSLGKKVLHEAAAQGNVEEVRKLLADDGEMKGLINDLDMFAYTPLHIAAENGQLEVCKALIELKADVNASTKMYSSTALHYGMSLCQYFLLFGEDCFSFADSRFVLFGHLFQSRFRGTRGCAQPSSRQWRRGECSH